ncbi:MAG: hypothetical protein E5W97_25780 [Mesorhizobium sp.]|nr:MAG: hypothetical protein E5W97_25780 [Mesorhizobium sp.]
MYRYSGEAGPQTAASGASGAHVLQVRSAPVLGSHHSRLGLTCISTHLRHQSDREKCNGCGRT